MQQWCGATIEKTYYETGKVQRVETRWVPTLRELNYERRLRKLNQSNWKKKKNDKRRHDNNVQLLLLSFYSTRSSSRAK